MEREAETVWCGGGGSWRGGDGTSNYPSESHRKDALQHAHQRVMDGDEKNSTCSYISTIHWVITAIQSVGLVRLIHIQQNL